MISKRLTEIASFINKNEVVYDVGTDHGLLPCFLISEGIARKVYASDNKEGPLNKARENISLYRLEDRIIPVLADGLDKCPKDVDVVTISGMGFNTVRGILDRTDLSSYKRLIIQVNKDTKHLRDYISKHNYTIENEKVIFDEFYYEVVSFNTNYHEPYSKLEIEYGPINLKNRNEDFINYISYELNKYREINQPKYNRKIEELIEILSYNK